MKSVLSIRYLVPLVLALIVSSGFFLYSLQYQGPLYLSDEVGYLSKAAVFAGYSIDAASSWHGGYSLILAPVFVLLNDPYMAWKGVLALNALMWGGSTLLLWYFLRKIFPEKKLGAVFAAVFLSMLYPAWISMSGYAFPTTAFVFVLMCAMAAFMKSELKNPLYLGLYAFAVGYLYWVHPTGIAVIAASALLFILKGILEKRFKLFLPYILIMLGMILVYDFLVHEWLNSVMTGPGLEATQHYNEALEDRITSLTDPGFWVRWVVNFLARLSYVFIATFGIILFSIPLMLRPGKRAIDRVRNTISSPTASAISVLVVAVVCLLLLVSAVANPVIRADIWIYGRYTEVLLLPLLGVGLLAKWRFRWVGAGAVFVLVTGFILRATVNESNTIFEQINQINLQSFWPLALYAPEHWPEYMVQSRIPWSFNLHGADVFFFWFLVGSVAVLLTGVVALLRRKWLIVLMVLPLFLLSIRVHQDWHSRLLNIEEYQPSGLYAFIRSNYEPGTCIGFDKPTTERIKLYWYYLYNYNLERMTPDQWRDECDGPYLTHETGYFEQESTLRIVGRETVTRQNLEILKRLHVGVRSDEADELMYRNGSGLADFLFNPNDELCVAGGCFTKRAASNEAYTQVGSYENGMLNSSGVHPGLLVYGPYYPVDKGSYRITLRGDFSDSDGQARIDVVSGEGGLTTHLDVPVKQNQDKQEFTFSLEEDAEDLQIRIYAEKGTIVKFHSYSVEPLRKAD